MNERTMNLNDRLTVLTDLITGLTTTVSERMNYLEAELMKCITAAQQQQSTPQSTNTPTPPTAVPQTPVPPTPRSWSMPEAPTTHHADSSQGIGARSTQQTPAPNMGASPWMEAKSNSSVLTFGIDSPRAPPSMGRPEYSDSGEYGLFPWGHYRQQLKPSPTANRQLW